jgi:sec-independent protein translocase protein TatB
MQMFGVGPLELIVILVVTVLVVGPDRLPQVAADLAQWIRRMRAYATHLTRDFNEVVSELEKEAGASREDWKEIAGVVTRQTSAVTSPISSAARALEKSFDEKTAEPPAPESTPLGELPIAATNGNGATAHPDEEAVDEATPEEEKAWYESDRPVRRRSRV